MRSSDILIKILDSQLIESESSQSEVSEQRERNHRYYACQPLGNEERGRSHYVDPVVFGTVEGKKATFSETFLSSREVVRFADAGNAQEAKAKGAYVQRTFKKNNYEELFRDGWHDAFVAKKMAVWADWEEDTETIELHFQGAPSAYVNQKVKSLGQIINVDSSQLQSDEVPPQGPMGGNVLQFPQQQQQQQRQYVHTGTLVVEVDASYVSLELIQPEFFFRDPTQAYCRDAMWNTMRKDLSKLVLIDEGYDPEQVEKLNIDNRYGSSEEDTSRKAYNDSNVSGYGQQQLRNSEQDEVTIYKTRTWLSLKEGDIEDFTPEPGLKLYEIHWTQDGVLRWAPEAANEGAIDQKGDDILGEPAIRIIEDHWVYEWTEMKVSHASDGLCSSDMEAHQQKAGSGLKRGVMDNMNVTNNPRYEAVLDLVHNERDLEDNVIGAVIDVERPGTVNPLQNPQLSPMTLGVMQMLQQDSEERSGQSGLAKGMNNAAVSNQNADDMIARLTNAGQRRVAMAARDFARSFLIPVMQCVIKIAMQYDKSQDTMEAGGRQIQIAPSQWTDDVLEMELEVALTPDEAAAMAKQMLIMHNVQKEDEVIAPLYGVRQRHAVFDTIYELMGIKDSTAFLATPESDQYKQHQEGKQQQFKMVMEDKQKAEASQQRNEQFQQYVIQEQLDQGWAKQNSDMLDKEEDNLLERDQYDTDTYQWWKEYELEKTQKRQVQITG